MILFELFKTNFNNQIKATLHVGWVVNDEIVIDTFSWFPFLPYPYLCNNPTLVEISGATGNEPLT